MIRIEDINRRRTIRLNTRVFDYSVESSYAIYLPVEYWQTTAFYCLDTSAFPKTAYKLAGYGVSKPCKGCGSKTFRIINGFGDSLCFCDNCYVIAMDKAFGKTKFVNGAYQLRKMSLVQAGNFFARLRGNRPDSDILNVRCTQQCNFGAEFGLGFTEKLSIARETYDRNVSYTNIIDGYFPLSLNKISEVLDSRDVLQFTLGSCWHHREEILHRCENMLRFLRRGEESADFPKLVARVIVWPSLPNSREARLMIRNNRELLDLIFGYFRANGITLENRVLYTLFHLTKANPARFDQNLPRQQLCCLTERCISCEIQCGRTFTNE